jgi:hypothetical protein
MLADKSVAVAKGMQGALALEPEDIENRIHYLLKFYTQARSPAIAQSIARHLELLAEHPLFEASGNQRCDYLRMRNHWRWLADPRPSGIPA